MWHMFEIWGRSTLYCNQAWLALIRCSPHRHKKRMQISMSIIFIIWNPITQRKYKNTFYNQWFHISYATMTRKNKKQTSVKYRFATNIIKATRNDCPGAMWNPNHTKGIHVTGPLRWESTGKRWIPLTKASEAELWCFLSSAPVKTVERTIETPVIWDAIALIMTSL